MSGKWVYIINNGKKSLTLSEMRVYGSKDNFAFICHWQIILHNVENPIFTEQSIHLVTASCQIEEDADYRVGSSKSISDWKGVTKQGCADLAASTQGGRYWTYRSTEHHCWVKADPGHPTLAFAKYAEGHFSGNADCGVRGLRGKWKLSDWAFAIKRVVTFRWRKIVP